MEPRRIYPVSYSDTDSPVDYAYDGHITLVPTTSESLTVSPDPEPPSATSEGAATPSTGATSAADGVVDPVGDTTSGSTTPSATSSEDSAGDADTKMEKANTPRPTAKP
jgi:hypothetical protein